MNTSLLAELLVQFESFSTEHPEAGLSAFGVWLAAQTAPPLPDDSLGVERGIGYVLGRLARFSRLYARIVFADIPISTIEEFWALNALHYGGRLTKGDVYHAVLGDKASGSQMLKRLERAGLVRSARDTVDTRVHWVTLTARGRRIRDRAFAALADEVRLKTLPLDTAAKQQLLAHLRTLDEFHTRIAPVVEREGFDGAWAHASRTERT